MVRNSAQHVATAEHANDLCMGSVGPDDGGDMADQTCDI